MAPAMDVWARSANLLYSLVGRRRTQAANRQLGGVLAVLALPPILIDLHIRRFGRRSARAATRRMR